MIMKARVFKKLATMALVVLLSSCGGSGRQTGSVHGIMGEVEERVYVCTGPMSKCYHRHSDCYGLENCSASVRAVSLQDARQMGRRPCRFCY